MLWINFPEARSRTRQALRWQKIPTRDAFSVLADHPERALRFGNAMKSFTEGSGHDLRHLVQSFPYKSLGKGTVVDVGGSNGFVCTRLASEFPDLHFIVQDLEPVIQDAEEAVPAEIRNRIRFMPHGFVEEQQPVKNADVYFIRWIFYNWSDKYCKIIFNNLIPALKPGARVVVMDNVLPEPGLLPHWQEERLRSMDLTMMEMQNSLERELDDWERLFTGADSRFKFKGGKMPQGSRLWILESQWDP